jgi:DNA-binding beta-propeller fold protein YncE
LINKFYQFGLLAGILFLGACASEPVKKSEIIWPLPPDPPRIKFVKTIDSVKEVEQKSFGRKIVEALAGADPVVHLQKPFAIHVDGKNRVFIADSGWRKILVLDYEKKDFMFLGVDGPGILANATGVATDRAGNIYVTDGQQKRVVVYGPDGKYLLAMGGEKVFERPAGIAVNDKLRRVYVVDTRKHNVSIFDFEGKLLSEFGGRGVNDGEFNFPTNLAIDGEGKIYVTDTLNFRIQIFDSDGRFLSKFGSIGTGLGQFSKPKGIGVDSEGHIYVVDAAFNNVQIFNQEGQLLLFFGDMGTHDGQMYLPAGLWVDKDDKIYVADQYNRRIDVFQYLGEKKKGLE